MDDNKFLKIWSNPDALGEGPIWHHREQALYWVDIANGILHRLNADLKKHQFWKMPGAIGCIAPCAKGGLIAGIDDEIYSIQLPSGKLERKVKVPGGLRLNDGKCDALGRLWIGNVNVNYPNAALYRFDPDHTLHKMDEGFSISNGLTWSLDHRTFYFTNSPARTIYAYDFNLQQGTIANKRIFVTTPDDGSEPDGLTIDEQGYLWSAQWNGSRIIRYSPQGQIDMEIITPIERPTSCMFGGAQLDRLFLTSCSRDINETKTLAEPAGTLFALDLQVRGKPIFEFAG